MKIKVCSSTMVKPVISKPSTTLWLSNMDLMMPLNFHMRIPFYYRSTEAPDFFDSAVLKAALSRTLVDFYPMAGRLIKNDSLDRVEICYNNEGVLFVEAESDGKLDDLADFAHQPELGLIPPVDYSLGISTFPLLLVQVTRFKCGGVCLAIAISHVLVDGFSMFHFMNTWSSVSRGVDIALAPSLDRRVLAARDPPQPQFTHVEYQAAPTLITTPQIQATETIFRVFRLTRDQLNALKANCQEQDDHINGVAYTTYEVLAGHVWRSVTKARALLENQETMLYIPIDGRSRMRPPLPPGYFGNAVFKATCIALCGELITNPLKFAVHKIHKSIAQVDGSYLVSAVDYLELQGTFKDPHMQKMDHQKSPNIAISKWAGFGVYDVDFGWGKPFYMGFYGNVQEGTTFVLPNPTNDGSLLYAILLPKDQMQVFEKLLYQI